MRVVFADATDGFTPDRKDTQPCGGILNSLTILPRYLAAKGWDVTVKSVYQENATVEGVKYVPISDKTSLPKWDIIVVNRNGINLPLINYSHSIGAKVVWWLHDIVDMRYLQDSAFRHVDKIVALSHYCKKSYASFYDIPEKKFVVIPNGVDKSVFFPGKFEERKRFRMLLASAPIKGVVPVRDTWLNVKRQFKDAELFIYSNQSLHDKQNSNEHTAFLKEMEEEGAKVMRPIPQAVLAGKMREAGVLLMPNSYPEICSNLLLQAQACGLPVVASNTGSNPEFIDHPFTGLITPSYPHDMWLWIKEYVETVVKLMGDEPRQRSISARAGEKVKSWDEVGGMWHDALSKLSK